MPTRSTAGLSFSYVDAPEVIALGAALPAAGIIIVSTRFYLRRVHNTRISADDWLILGALMMVVGMGACLIAGAKDGVMGYPTPPPPALSPAELETYVEPAVRKVQEIEFSFQIMMLISYALVKLSIIYFLRRLFVVGKSGTFNLVTIAMAIVITLWLIAFLGLFIFHCGSVVKNDWGSLATISTTCKYSFTAELGMASSDLILDLSVLALPFPMIWKLHMSKPRKAAISGVFLIGLAAIAASITRLVIYVQILTKANKVIIDEDLAITVAMYWSLLEAGLALIAACLPSLSLLFAKRSLASVISSVRSALSLRSLRNKDKYHSQQSASGQNLQTSLYKEMPDDQSTASHVNMVAKDSLGIESFAMGDLEGGHIDSVRGEGIHVKNELTQEGRVV